MKKDKTKVVVWEDPKDENHMQMFARLIKAGQQGIHGKPGQRKPKGGGR